MGVFVTADEFSASNRVPVIFYALFITPVAESLTETVYKSPDKSRNRSSLKLHCGI